MKPCDGLLSSGGSRALAPPSQLLARVCAVAFGRVLGGHGGAATWDEHVCCVLRAYAISGWSRDRAHANLFFCQKHLKGIAADGRWWWWWWWVGGMGWGGTPKKKKETFSLVRL